MKKVLKQSQVNLQMIYPFKFYEAVKGLRRIGFDVTGYTKYVDKRTNNARDSKKNIKQIIFLYYKHIKYKRKILNI